MGASQEAALFAGIRVKRIKLLLFVVSGVVCALAGVLLDVPALAPPCRTTASASS